MTDKQLFEAFDNILDELDEKKLLPKVMFDRMEDSFIYLEKLLAMKGEDSETTWEYLLVTDRNSSYHATNDTNTRIWRILWLKHTTILKNYTNQY